MLTKNIYVYIHTHLVTTSSSMFLTMFSPFAKSDISKYGHSHSSENAKGNIILTNCALEKIKIPIFVEHFTKPLRINSLIESSVIVWRRRSAFQILIQKGHMHVYVPYPKILKNSKKFWDLNAWTFFLKASPDCGLLEAIANWYWHKCQKRLKNLYL